MERSRDSKAFDPEELLSIAIEAAESASKTLLTRFRPPVGASLELHYKGPGDLVTDADIAADRAIADVLEARNAPGNFLSEESSNDRGNGEFTWLIDPLCGTLPFSTGLPHWGVNIALSIEMELVIGVVALPTSNELISAVRGRGAYLNGKKLEAKEPPGNPRDVAIAIEGDSRLFTEAERALAEAAGRQYNFGSAAYPLGQVLLGRLHGAVFKEVSVHTAASVVIARELGVRVTDEAGNEVEWGSHTPSGSLVVAWPLAHKTLLDAVR